MSSKKDKDTKSRKRDRPDEKEWQWEDTLLKDPDTTKLLMEDVKQLLLTRGETKQSLKGKKVEMIEFLKEKYKAELAEPLESLTAKELKAELRLRGLDDSAAVKKVLIQRLKGEIDATAPPAKKPRRGKKPKGPTTQVFVTLYTPPMDAEDTNTTVLGAFKTEYKAYQKGMDQLLGDLQRKLGDDKKDVYESTAQELDDIDEKDYKMQMEALNKAVLKAWGKDDDAPYCDISQTSFS